MRKIVAALFLATFVACGGDSITDANANITGTYSLRTVNGSPLPFTVFTSGTTRIEIVDDAVTITEAGTYSESGHTRTTTGSQVTTDVVSEVGTWTRNGSTVTFRSTDGLSVSTGAVSGSTITIIDTGISAVYTK